MAATEANWIDCRAVELIRADRTKKEICPTGRLHCAGLGEVEEKRRRRKWLTTKLIRGSLLPTYLTSKVLVNGEQAKEVLVLTHAVSWGTEQKGGDL